MLGRILRSLSQAFRDSLRPRIVLLIFVCLVLGAALWGGLLFVAGVPLLAWLTLKTGFDWTGFLGQALFAVLTFPLFVIVALALLSVLAVPWVRRVLKKRGLLERPFRGGISLPSQIRQIIQITVLGLIGWSFCLLFFWVPLVPPLLSFFILTWVQWRLLTLDTWGDSQNQALYGELLKKHRGEGLFLSAILSGFAMVPILNLYIPVLAILTFLHWDQELQREKA